MGCLFEYLYWVLVLLFVFQVYDGLKALQLAGKNDPSGQPAREGEGRSCRTDFASIDIFVQEIRETSVVLVVTLYRRGHNNYEETFEVRTDEEDYFHVFPSPCFPWQGYKLKVEGERLDGGIVFHPWMEGAPSIKVGPANFGS